MINLKQKKGVSSILGTILIISITLALGGLLYGYSKGLFSNLSTNEDLYTQYNLLSSSNIGFLQYTLKNQGNVALHVEYIKIVGNNTNQIISVDTVIEPGQEIQNISQVSNIIPGNYYSIIVVAQTPNGQLYDSVSNVLAVSQ
ncbi:hypothetical protein L3N51_00316 [Metallosphaera sp. J1]|uniref:pilin subunit UpsA n=1 Tax=Metallosphaera TaxID=41980 RepID=UPI001EDE75C3|nr:archaellin/type IV pilin N-terminal domain-containing protein [Metallosphaera javensis (ex Hofmann et al. 2022)]MCG3108038.1 hypothetical protein [Metallosphaera javensis (ex Hofmann et al. 2022)]BCS91803.1 MAG: hypothetical protein MjAS7_0411 [Metallosphaera javensis (ex Sakai et al. 2022)]